MWKHAKYEQHYGCALGDFFNNSHTAATNFSEKQWFYPLQDLLINLWGMDRYVILDVIHIKYNRITF